MVGNGIQWMRELGWQVFHFVDGQPVMLYGDEAKRLYPEWTREAELRNMFKIMPEHWKFFAPNACRGPR